MTKAILIAFAPLILKFLFVFVVIVFITVMQKRKYNIKHAQRLAEFVYGILKIRYGDKADHFYELWKECLKKAEENNWSKEDATKYFFNMIEIVLAESRNVEVSDMSIEDLSIDKQTFELIFDEAYSVNNKYWKYF